MPKITTMIKNTLRKFGIEASRPGKKPYEELKEAPRYQPHTVDLLGKPFRIADGISFFYSYQEVFLKNTYRFVPVHERPLIIDLGSNYGTSITYFKTEYPNAKVIGVEADPKIFEILKWNIEQRDFKNVTLLNKAISESKEPLSFHHEGSCGGRVHTLDAPKETFKVEPVSMDAFLEEPVDFLKMDVEGAESEAILASKNLHHVSQMFFEYHCFKDAEQTLGAILEKLKACGFRYYIHGHFCSPRPLTHPTEQLGLDLQLNIFAVKK